ncbi:MAG: GGDEF domain-containing protein [Spirochaetota bacterium]
MNQRVRIAIAVLASLLAAGAIAGLLLGRAGPGPVDHANLRTTLGLIARAQGQVEALATVARASGDHAAAVEALAQRTQRELVGTVAAVTETDSTALADVDALLIAILEAVQRFAASGFTEPPGQLETLTAALATERAEVSSLQADVLTPAPGGAVQRILSVGAIVLGIALVLIVVFAGRAPSAAGAAPSRPPAGATSGGDRTVSERERERVAAPGRRSRAAAEPITPGVSGSRTILDAAHFVRVLERERDRSARYAHPLAAVVMTVDQAQSIRSDHGAEALEYVVGSIAELSDDNTRTADTVGIVTEHRVAVLLPETDVVAAERVADKLSRNVARFPFDDGIHVTVSCGCVDALRNAGEIVPDATL